VLNSLVQRRVVEPPADKGASGIPFDVLTDSKAPLWIIPEKKATTGRNGLSKATSENVVEKPSIMARAFQDRPGMRKMIRDAPAVIQTQNEGGGIYAHGFVDGDEAVIIVDRNPRPDGPARIMIVCSFFLCSCLEGHFPLLRV